MPLHETKICPRCSQEFMCKAGNIASCQCSSILLSAEETALIEAHYGNCLCINCLIDLKKDIAQLPAKNSTPSIPHSQTAFFNWSGGKDSALALYKCLQQDTVRIDHLLTSINAVH